MTTVWDLKLFNEDNAKTIKGEKLGVLTLILYLAPAGSASEKLGRTVNVCPYSTPGCVAACLNTAGRGAYTNVQDSRQEKTVALFQDRKRFLDKCEREIRNALKRASLLGLKLAVRMNGTSDLPFLDVEMAKRFPEVQFYGYTKVPYIRDIRHGHANIHLTYSWAETEENKCSAAGYLSRGKNVAVVFNVKRGQPLPTTWNGYTVIDGDEHDVRFLDPKGVVVGLRAKGKARKDTSGFVVSVQ